MLPCRAVSLARAENPAAAPVMNQLFYTTTIENGFATLDEEESRHLTSVLRKKAGDTLSLTDGKGFFYEAEIVDVGKKQVSVRILSQTEAPEERPYRIHIAIAPTKQMERLEWFLEKATELGVDEITPLLCKRSERETIRLDRLEKILVSAMKQSLRAHLPKLNPLTTFQDFIKQTDETERYLAWCAEEPLPHLKEELVAEDDLVIAIGPEGDFSPEETLAAFQAGFSWVSLGESRLRTETAGLYAVMLAGG